MLRRQFLSYTAGCGVGLVLATDAKSDTATIPVPSPIIDAGRYLHISKIFRQQSRLHLDQHVGQNTYDNWTSTTKRKLREVGLNAYITLPQFGLIDGEFPSNYFEKRKLTIPVGNIPPEEVPEYMQMIARTFKRHSSLYHATMTYRQTGGIIIRTLYYPVVEATYLCLSKSVH